jgi:hypothetical protein
MADFCNVCATRLFGDNCPPEIDVPQIVKGLKKNEFSRVLCEGCGMVAIERDLETNEVMLVTYDHEEKTHTFWSLEEWERGDLADKYN